MIVRMGPSLILSYPVIIITDKASRKRMRKEVATEIDGKMVKIEEAKP